MYIFSSVGGGGGGGYICAGYAQNAVWSLFKTCANDTH